ncbi:MAG: hypothetical protein ACFFC7_25975 [Candidatus Hermodarchaeota archaeon]
MQIGRTVKFLYKSLKKVPVPKGMSSKEIVKRAIKFDNPPRIPYLFFFHPTAGDIFDLAFIGEGLLSKPNRNIVLSPY